jgi:dTDP-4-dehydrorhamnose 3,5-epimerase
MGKLKMHPTRLAGLELIESLPASDDRGQFSRIFCEEEYALLRPNIIWKQINLSSTYRKGTIRGLHYQQPPSTEAKLIRCLRGKIFDVAVDLRANSSTQFHWYSVELAEDNDLGIFIPEGFAHGFQALCDDVQLLYMHTQAWDRHAEGAIRYDDPTLSIEWPLAATRVSEKDRSAPLIDDSFAGITL